MTAKSILRTELTDQAHKLRSAKKAAAAPEATERDKSDLKIIEQQFQADKMKLNRNPDGARADQPKKDLPLPEKMERQLDSALKDSFPGSDPVSFLEAAPVKPGDKDLTAVKASKD